MSEVRPALICLADLAAIAAEAIQYGDDWLTQQERERFEAMRSLRRRQQFIAGHWLARRLAAQASVTAAGDWLLATDERGAPRLRHRQVAATDLHASLSHSGEWVACAISDRPIGIDLECDMRSRDLERLAAEVFPEAQWRSLRDLPEAGRRRGFYEQWTLREAVGKREGRGLSPGVARTQYFERVDPRRADALGWQFDDVSFALSTTSPTEVDITGLPENMCVRGWRLVVP